MSGSISEKFGWFVRQRRQAKGISLRQMAKRIRVSPAYLSQVERGQFTPPAEDKVTAIAEILDLDVDELLALAGKVSSDVTQIIREHPREMAGILRGTRGMSDDERAKLFKRFVAASKKKENPRHQLNAVAQARGGIFFEKGVYCQLNKLRGNDRNNP